MAKALGLFTAAVVSRGVVCCTRVNDGSPLTYCSSCSDCCPKTSISRKHNLCEGPELCAFDTRDLCSTQCFKKFLRFQCVLCGKVPPCLAVPFLSDVGWKGFSFLKILKPQKMFVFQKAGTAEVLFPRTVSSDTKF